MRYTVKCNNCGRDFVAETEQYGTMKYRCPYCGNVLNCRFDAPKSLRMRGYSVDVGQVIQNTKNEKGISERKQLEVDFVCNRGQDRIYIQSAYALLSEEKTEQELRSLKQIKDSFLKVVIVGGMQPTFRNDDGILILNIFDFLLNRSGQNL